MKSQISHLIAEALYSTKSYSLPAVCERYGLEPGNGDEAFNSKRQYVLRRLEKLSDEKVVQDLDRRRLMPAATGKAVGLRTEAAR